MKILSVCSNFRVFGAETITLKMLEGFKQRGHQQLAVTSIWSADGEFSRRLAVLGIPELQLPLGTITKRVAPRQMWWMANTLAGLPFAWLKWARLLRRFQPDVLVFTSSRLCLLLYPWLDRCPSFLIEYTNIQASRSNWHLYRMLSHKLTKFVAVSDFMRAHLQQCGAPPEKIAVVKSGAFSEGQRHIEANHPTALVLENGQIPRLGIVGQVAPDKGHDCFIEAVGILKERGIEVKVHVFGTGIRDYVSTLKEKIHKKGLAGQWQWMGYERDKAKIFRAIDICVVPSCFGDPFPTVAMEAGVYGLPVVARRAGGLPEIVQDGVTGWLVEPNTPKQLAERIAWLIREPSRAREMGFAGSKRVLECFTVEKMVTEFESLFRVHGSLASSTSESYEETAAE